MGLREFLTEIPDRGIRCTADELWVGIRRRTNWLERRSTHVYKKDWDVLLVLDACRADLMRSVVDEYDFINGENTIYSVGPTSQVWLKKTFGPLSDEELGETAYITGNPFSARVDIQRDQFARFDEAWRYGWDEDIGGIPPRELTDRAINVGRNVDVERMIVHYMQPHIPFIDHPELTRKMKHPENGSFGTPDMETVWDKLRTGQVDENELWEAYRDNLRLVLDDVKLLRKNIDADTMVLSADHGNAMGERNQYGHGPHSLVKPTCEVPWETTTATDEGRYKPTIERSPETDVQASETDVQARLRDLGYME